MSLFANLAASFTEICDYGRSSPNLHLDVFKNEEFLGVKHGMSLTLRPKARVVRKRDRSSKAQAEELDKQVLD